MRSARSCVDTRLAKPKSRVLAATADLFAFTSRAFYNVYWWWSSPETSTSTGPMTPAMRCVNASRREAIVPQADQRHLSRDPIRRSKPTDCGPFEQANRTSRQIALIALAGSVACISALVANWAIGRFGVSSEIAGSAAFCISWIALYPWVRLNRKGPKWIHWARGAFVLVVLWLAILLSRR